MPRTKDHTLSALDALVGDLYAATVDGVRDQLDQYPDTGHTHRTTTKRSITRDHIVDRLRSKLDGNSNIRIEDDNQTTYFHLFSEYKMLVKKSDEVGAVQLSKTQASFDFQKNEAQLHLDTSVFPDVTNLYLGYIPNESDPRNPSVVLICPRKDGINWMHELEPPAAFIAGEIGSSKPVGSVEEEELVRVPSVKKAKPE